MKRPAFQFYPADWRKDMALQSCSVAARGLWIDMLCIAHECEPYGHLTVNGRAMTAAQIGRHTGLTEREAAKLIDELDDAGVLSRNDQGVIFSRRMVRDEDLRNRRAAGGQAGAEHGAKGAPHGAKGGRPRTVEGGIDNPPSDDSRGDTKPPLKPPPSSSSSSSPSGEDPQTPKGGKSRRSAVCLKSWLEAERAAGHKPIADDDPVLAYADSIGLPHEFLRLAWTEFKQRYSQPGAKRYTDWRAVFRNAVRRDWLRLWRLDAGSGQYSLTTAGEQARRAHEMEAA